MFQSAAINYVKHLLFSTIKSQKFCLASMDAGTLAISESGSGVIAKIYLPQNRPFN